MNKRSGTLLLFAGSVTLILVAIIFSALIDKSKSTGDTRSRASQTGPITLTGQVESFDQATNVLTVTNVKFADTNGKSLGTWSVTPPSTFNPVKFAPGTKVKIVTSPATFQIDGKLVTATDITK